MIAKKGIIEAISISKKRGTKKYNVESARFIENYGIEEDAHAGKWHRQISLLSLESLHNFNTNSQVKIKAGEFSENILISGVGSLTSLPIGSLIKLGDEVVLKITQHGKECHTNCTIFQNIGKCIMPTEGIFAKVIKGGIVKRGDKIEASTEYPTNN